MFKAAKPIWVKNYRQMCNIQAGFRCDFVSEKGKRYILRITGASVFRVYLNGKFLHYGPARAAHGFFRCDEIKFVAEGGINKLAVEVAGYNCNGFYTLKHDSFLIAEILDLNGNVIGATGRNFNGILLEELRKRKVFRFTFQRDFQEVWELDNSTSLTRWKTDDNLNYDSVAVMLLTEEFIKRETPVPKFGIVNVSDKYEQGRFIHKIGTDRYSGMRFANVSCEMDGYLPDIIPDRPAEEIYGEFVPKGSENEKSIFEIGKGEYVFWEFKFNDTGFLKTRILSIEDSVVYLVFSEKKRDNVIAFDNGANGINIIKYTLKASEIPYNVEAFEPHTCKYVGIVVTKGCVTVSDVCIREYCYPRADAAFLETDNEKLNLIFKAARETFRQNTLDVYMDCPDRERGAWLCDSYFMAHAEYLFTMDTVVEKVFFENFLMAREFPCIPDGMVPMCYPGDHFRGKYIPQYAFWFILQFDEYMKRALCENAEKFRNILYGIVMLFRSRLNDEGFLENLDGWNFIEWSEANNYMEGVNIPTNMLFSKACMVVSRIFDDKELAAFAKDLNNRIVVLAFDGNYFSDNAVRNQENKLIATDNRSEICQYLAFFCGIADEKFSTLKEKLTLNCGIDKENKKLAKANMFVGNYIRLALLLEWEKNGQCIREIEDGFYKMAMQTGTLWEHDSDLASLNHGFASYAAAALFRAVSGICSVDRKSKMVYVQRAKNHSVKFKARLELENGEITVSDSGEIALPDGWNVKYVM